MNIDGILFLAPLAGISNRSFRHMARKYGADFCYTEMISADAVVYNQRKTIAMIDIFPDDHPIGIQLFGSSPEKMARAIKALAGFEANLFDINIGCPVKKITRKNGGAALLKEPKLAEEIMVAAVETSGIPVTIKMRTGWEIDSDVYLEVGKMAEKAGIAAITLHPRSCSAGFSGKSDWSKIAALKRAVSIPVIGNGDIKTVEDARNMLSQTGCDAIMVGRAAMTNPYILQQIKSYLKDGEILLNLTVKEMIKLALEHSRLVIDQFGEKAGALKMRKHLAWYSRGFEGGAILRGKLMAVNSYSDIHNFLNDYLNRLVV
ncbi:MAG: tRNA dihydrouridine synthase DusB [candidate division Zixibacteria bacterium]|nr:tRNA dihydrouridine synthase DusB [candidate division Zixibacteria bacterium]